MIDYERQRERIQRRLKYYLNLPLERPESYRKLKARIIPRLHRALLKISAGTYQQCDHCGEEIGTERLEKVPAALLCHSCQGELERKVKGV